MEKTVFITGGSTGIGAASVKKFIQQGWKVGFIFISWHPMLPVSAQEAITW